ncbi:MAG TPA: YraN family protein [Candidatus Saccharimonadales bacterium]
MTTTEIGRKAESVAADFLVRKGCTIVDRNWRTRWCEVDVIAARDNVVFLCEVKYRRRSTQGTGVEYITAGKLHQMQFAAHFWTASHNWQGECQLCAIEVSGDDFRITGVFKDVI